MKLLILGLLTAAPLMALSTFAADNAKNTAIINTNTGAVADPVAEMEKTAERIDVFFSTSPTMLVKLGPSDASPTGIYSYKIKYTKFDTVSYDVRKTDSLVSPIVAHVTLKLDSATNSKCGVLPYLGSNIGWPSTKDALEARNSSNCFELRSEKPDPETVRFDFAYQKNQWVLKSITRTHPLLSTPLPAYPILAAIGSPGQRWPGQNWQVPDEEASAQFNREWRRAILGQ